MIDTMDRRNVHQNSFHNARKRQRAKEAAGALVAPETVEPMAEESQLASNA